jgi:uncharacterized membrane protein
LSQSFYAIINENSFIGGLAISHKPMEKRVYFWDQLRGFAVFCMIFYHAFYSMASMFLIDWANKLLMFFEPVEPLFAGLFIVISGICTHFSRSNFLRGAKLLFIALGISLVTNLFLPSQRIQFGILHLLSCCMIFCDVLRPLLDKLPIYVNILVCCLFYLLTSQISSGFIGLPFFRPIRFYLPHTLYQKEFLFSIGICTDKFYSSDYFPLLPWMFIFFLGVVIGRWFASIGYSSWMYKNYIPFFSFLGKYSLLTYLIHQPVIYVVLWAIFALKGGQ